MAGFVGGGPPTMGQDMPWSPNSGGMPGRRKPTGSRRPPYIPGFDPGTRGNEPEIYTGRGGGPSAPGMGGGGFGQAGSNQGSTGFGGAGWSDMTPTLGGGMGGGTTPNSPPVAGQPPTMNTPTGGMPAAGGPPSGFGQGPGVVYPNAGSDAARQKTYQSNTGGINMPGSPTTPNIPNQSQPFDVFDFSGTGGGGGGYQPPTRGTGPITNKYNNTLNITGPTSTSITKGDEYAQKTPEKTFRKPKIAMGQKEIGDPKLAMQQLSAMQQTPFMRRA